MGKNTNKEVISTKYSVILQVKESGQIISALAINTLHSLVKDFQAYFSLTSKLILL